MSSHCWSKFWWQDWQRDPALSMCSVAARGMWMDMLCVMAASEPHGYFLVNGRTPNLRQIGVLSRVTEREAEKLLGELEENGVFSRDQNDTIYCRRMVRDHEVSEMGKVNGRRGGNPTLKPHVNGQDNGGGNQGGLTPGPTHDQTPPLKLQEAEAEAESESEAEEERTLTSFGRSVARRAGGESARSKLWVEGVPLLQRLTGKPERGAKSLLGLVLTRLHDDCAQALALIREVEALDAADPAAWLLAAARPPPKPSAQQRHAASMRETLRIFGLLDDDDSAARHPPVALPLQ